MSKKNLFLLLLILGTAFWGISFTFVKTGISVTSPFIFLFYKFLTAAVAVALWFYRQIRLITFNTIRIGTLISIPLLAATILQTISLRYTPIGNAAFITGFEMVLVPVLKFFIYKKPVKLNNWIACLLAVTGLFIISAADQLRISYGDLLALACSFGFALYVLQVAHVSNEEHPIPAVIVLMLVCAVGCGLMALFDGDVNWVPADRDFWQAVLFAALPATAFMYSVQNAAQRYLPEEKIALVYLCEPVFATVAGVIFLHEALTERIIFGGGFIIAAMVISELRLNWLKRLRRS